MPMKATTLVRGNVLRPWLFLACCCHMSLLAENRLQGMSMATGDGAVQLSGRGESNAVHSRPTADRNGPLTPGFPGILEVA
jgi:hypothetical protein